MRRSQAPKARSIQWERLFRARSSECGRQSEAAGAASDHRPHRGCRAGMGSPVPPESKSRRCPTQWRATGYLDAAAEHHESVAGRVVGHTDRCANRANCGQAATSARRRSAPKPRRLRRSCRSMQSRPRLPCGRTDRTPRPLVDARGCHRSRQEPHVSPNDNDQSSWLMP
jgi:hypothetical protein